jgi:hypothetical protein
MSDDTDEALKTIAADVKAVLDKLSTSVEADKAVRDLIALALDPRAVKRNLRQLHDALAAVSAAQSKLDAERAEFVEWKAKEIADFEPQRRQAVRLFEIATAKTKEAEAQKNAAEALGQRNLGRERELEQLGVRVPAEHRDYTPPTVHHDFIPIAGTSITRAPEPRPRPPGESEPQAEQQSHTIRRGPGDASDWPANVSLTRQAEPQAVRVRVGRKGATHAE